MGIPSSIYGTLIAPTTMNTAKIRDQIRFLIDWVGIIQGQTRLVACYQCYQEDDSSMDLYSATKAVILSQRNRCPPFSALVHYVADEQ